MLSKSVVKSGWKSWIFWVKNKTKKTKKTCGDVFLIFKRNVYISMNIRAVVTNVGVMKIIVAVTDHSEYVYDTGQS